MKNAKADPSRCDAVKYRPYSIAVNERPKSGAYVTGNGARRQVARLSGRAHGRTRNKQQPRAMRGCGSCIVRNVRRGAHFATLTSVSACFWNWLMYRS